MSANIGGTLNIYAFSPPADSVILVLAYQNGVDFEKDLGKDTENLAKAMTDFNPDNSWTALKLEIQIGWKKTQLLREIIAGLINKITYREREVSMRKITKLTFAAGLLTLLSSLPLMAQATFQVTFSAAFSFYAGGAKLPPGTYTIRQSEDEQNIFTIQNSAGTHTVTLEGRQSSKTSSGNPEILFNRYGTSEYLEGVETSSGNSTDFETGIAEKVAAKKGSPQSHTVPGK